MGAWWRSFFSTFDKRALAQGRPHPKAQLGQAIQVRRHLVNVALPFRFDEDSHRAHAANAQAGRPRSGRAVVENDDRIWQSPRQIKRAAFPGTKFGVVVVRRGLSDFNPGLGSQIRNIAPPCPASVKLLVYLDGNNDLAKQTRQQLKTAEPVQIDQRRCVRDGVSHGGIVGWRVRSLDLRGFLGRR